MNSDFLTTISDISNRLVSDTNSIAETFDMLKKASALLGSTELNSEIHNAEKRYYYLLRFISQSTGDFSANDDMEKIREEIKLIVARAVNLWQENDNTSLKGSQLRYQRRRPEENIHSLVSDLLIALDRLHTDPLALTDSRVHAQLEQIAIDLFKRIWASDPISTDEERLLDTIIADSSIPSYLRQLFINAIGLGMEQHMPAWRVRLLQNAMVSSNKKLAITAELWLIISILAFQKHIPGIEFPHAEEIYHAFVRTLAPNNFKIADIMSLGRKMQGMSLESPNFSSEDFETIKRFQAAQMRGDDIFSATLGRMRQFPFFHETANWFLPFTARHSALAEIFDGEGAAIADLVENMPMLSDADKYALVISMAAMPSTMRANALSSMVDNLRQVSDTEEFREAMEASAPTDSMIIGQFIASLQRYIADNIEGKRTVLAQKFQSIALGVMSFVSPDIDQSEECKLIVSLCENEKYENALLVNRCIRNGEQRDYKTLCALGKAAEELGDVVEQYFYYEAAYNLEPGKKEAVLGMARINTNDNSEFKNVELLEPLIKNYPDDAELLGMLGYAYIARNDFDNAVNTLYHLDYIVDGNRAKAQLAWALTLSGDFENAALCFNESPDSKNISTQIRKGIMLWMSGKRADAITHLLPHASLHNETEFYNMLDDAIRKTGELGVKSDVRLLPDIIRYNIRRGSL